MLLRAINMSGKIHMVPALINDDYVIRFAICAQHAVDDDVIFAWNVIAEMATHVLAMCDTNKETETLKEFHRIESLEVSVELYNCTVCMQAIFMPPENLNYIITHLGLVSPINVLVRPPDQWYSLPNLPAL